MYRAGVERYPAFLCYYSKEVGPVLGGLYPFKLQVANGGGGEDGLWRFVIRSSLGFTSDIVSIAKVFS